MSQYQGTEHETHRGQQSRSAPAVLDGQTGQRKLERPKLSPVFKDRPGLSVSILSTGKSKDHEYPILHMLGFRLGSEDHEVNIPVHHLTNARAEFTISHAKGGVFLLHQGKGSGKLERKRLTSGMRFVMAKSELHGTRVYKGGSLSMTAKFFLQKDSSMVEAQLLEPEE